MPSLKVIQGPDEPHILLQYKRALALWSSHCADEAVFGAAGIYANAQLRDIAEANSIHGPLGEQDAAEAMRYFTEARVRPLAWYMPEESPAIEGLGERVVQIWRLDSLNAFLPQTHAGLTIIPARASFAHVREFAAYMRPGAAAEQAGEAAMCHLDDARVDALLALHEGKAAAYASVLSTGEFGFIMEFHVREDLRDRGFGHTMAGRILDVCARSLFRTVCCAIDDGDEAAKKFAHQLGFSLAERATLRTA